MPGSWGNALRQWGVRKQEAARRASLVSRVKIINFNGGGGLYGMSDTGSSQAASRPPPAPLTSAQPERPRPSAQNPHVGALYLPPARPLRQ